MSRDLRSAQERYNDSVARHKREHDNAMREFEKEQEKERHRRRTEQDNRARRGK